MDNIYIFDSSLGNGDERPVNLAAGVLVMTREEAKERGCTFSPGHPIANSAYRMHPLSRVDGAGKSNCYLSDDHFDRVLFEEREAELIKILICLGADNISISSCLSPELPSKGTDSTREFELKGVEWFSNSHLDRSLFPWLAYEPAWETVIMARELGGCTSARFELKQVAANECGEWLSIVDVQFNDVIEAEDELREGQQ